MQVPIRNIDIRGLSSSRCSPHPSPLVIIKYQTLCQNMLIVHQITSLIAALPSNWFGLLCFKSGNIEQGTKET